MGRVKFVTLLLTHRCNLRCSYCYVRDYTGENMELETAKEIVRESFRECEGKYDFLELTYLGGEPFMAFPLLRELSEWIWSREWPLPYQLTAVTNGTLLTGEAKGWLEENCRRITPSLSFDGEEAQNVTRSESLPRVDLDWYHTLWPNTAVKMTIAEENVGSLFRDLTGLWERGIPVNDTFAGGVKPWREESLAELDRQFSMLTEYLLEKKPKFRSELLSIDLIRALYPEPLRPFACGAGEIRETYDLDGIKYPCHLLSPLVLTEREREAYKSTENAPFQAPERCKSCALDALCPRCDGNSFRLFGRFGEREEALCGLFHRQALHACRFQARAILRKPEPDQRDRLTILAIDKLMRGFPNGQPGG